MKKILFLSFLLIGTGSFAQKINFKSTDAKIVTGDQTQFNCFLSELASADQASAIVEKMKTVPGILKIEVSDPKMPSAALTITTNVPHDTEILQKALLAAGFNNFFYDEKERKTGEINNIVLRKR